MYVRMKRNGDVVKHDSDNMTTGLGFSNDWWIFGTPTYPGFEMKAPLSEREALKVLENVQFSGLSHEGLAAAEEQKWYDSAKNELGKILRKQKSEWQIMCIVPNPDEILLTLGHKTLPTFRSTIFAAISCHACDDIILKLRYGRATSKEQRMNIVERLARYRTDTRSRQFILHQFYMAYEIKPWRNIAIRLSKADKDYHQAGCTIKLGTLCNAFCSEFRLTWKDEERKDMLIANVEEADKAC